MSKKKKSRKIKKFKNIFKKDIDARNVRKAEIIEDGDNFKIKFKEKMNKLKDTISEKNKNIKEWQANFIAKLRVYFKKIGLNFKKWNNIFCTGMTCRTNIKRDAVIISVAILVAAFFLGMGQYTAAIKAKMQDNKNEIVAYEEISGQFEEMNMDKIKTIQDQISVENWKEYKSAWYGFKIKYPEDWKAPLVRPYSRFSSAAYRVSFMVENQADKNFIGFDVAIYDINKTKEFFQTDEFPKLKENFSGDKESCKNIQGHLLETGDYPAEEIYIPQGDDCYNAALFFTVVEGQYIYNITPRLKEGVTMESDPMVEVSDTLPEFFAAVSQFDNIDIVRPKPKPVQPKITAPMPASYKVVGGRLVCEKGNDKPSKSDKNKKRHLDMECCLDPDEYPNPHCYYDPGKYGKYLK